MPNYCSYDMHVKGAPGDVDAFIALMTDYDAPKHFYRVFDATEYDRADNGDGTVTAMICGDCAWSVASCMTTDSPMTYCSSHEDGTSLMEQSADKHLDIEVYSEEPGMCFAEHYLYRDGEEIVNEEIPFELYQFEPSRWELLDDEKLRGELEAEFAEFKDEYGLPDEVTLDDVDPDCGDIRIGGYGELEWSV